MRIVGIRRNGGAVEVASLSSDGAEVTVLAGLEEFWDDAAGFVAREPAGETVAASSVTFVPPVLPGARVICIGLNYLKHVAEGSFAEVGVPPHPTLFARWTQSLAVDGAEVRTSARGSWTPAPTRRWPPSSATRPSTTSPRVRRRS
jgi:2-keto-4-pentenoate hydratase/2-oxohepta-3-ene-1,7-dioic acid hydratase in catechol pathway